VKRSGEGKVVDVQHIVRYGRVRMLSISRLRPGEQRMLICRPEVVPKAWYIFR
jgi:hypothetical protein